jgi:hypothetical protein
MDASEWGFHVGLGLGLLLLLLLPPFKEAVAALARNDMADICGMWWEEACADVAEESRFVAGDAIDDEVEC